MHNAALCLIYMLLAVVLILPGCSLPAKAVNEIADSHFHSSNYAMQGISLQALVDKYMGDKISRSVVFALPLQQKWDYYENINRKRLYTVTSKLIALKKTEPVFQTSDYYMNVGGAIKTIRWNGTDNTVIAIGNFDVTSRNYTVNFPSAGTWYDYFWADSLVLENPSVQISLQPGEYRFYSSKKLNGFGSINIGFDAPIASEKIRIYPNPARNQINITGAGKIKSIVIYTLPGKVMMEKFPGSDKETIDISGLPEGMYFLRTCYDNAFETSRFVKMQ